MADAAGRLKDATAFEAEFFDHRPHGINDGAVGEVGVFRGAAGALPFLGGEGFFEGAVGVAPLAVPAFEAADLGFEAVGLFLVVVAAGVVSAALLGLLDLLYQGVDFAGGDGLGFLAVERLRERAPADVFREDFLFLGRGRAVLGGEALDEFDGGNVGAEARLGAALGKGVFRSDAVILLRRG